MAKVTELVTKFMFEGDTAPLARYNAELGSSIKLIAGMTAAAVAAGAVIAGWSHAVLQGVDTLANLSSETGVAVDRIQELGFAADMSGSSANALNASLLAVSKNAGLAAKGMGAGKEIFKELGVNVKDANGHVKNSADLLDEVRRRMNALDMSIDERRGLASRLGIDASLIQYLMRTDSEMETLIARARELGTLTQEQAEAAAAYNDSLTVMNYAMNAIKQQVAVGLAPAMTDLANKFTDVLAENKDWIINGIRVTTEFIGNLLAMINRLLPLIAVLTGAFVIAKIVTLGWAGALGILFSPVVLITAGIVALALIIDDLIVAFKGGDSIIGNFFKNFLGIDLSDHLWILQEIGGALLAIGKFVAAITFDYLIASIQTLWKISVAWFTAWYKVISLVIKGLTTVFGWIGKIGSVLSGKIGKFLNMGKSDEDLARLDGNGETASNEPLVVAPKTVTVLPPDVTVGGFGLAAGVAAANNTDNRKIEQTVNMEIHAADPVAAGRAAADGVQRQLKDANAQLGVGGL